MSAIDADEHAAVPADHERALARVEDVRQTRREVPCVRHQPRFIAHVTGCARVVVVDVATAQHHPCVDRAAFAEAAVQACLSQGFGRLARAGHASALRRAKTEVRGCRDECDHAPSVPVASDAACPRRSDGVMRRSDRRVAGRVAGRVSTQQS